MTHSPKPLKPSQAARDAKELRALADRIAAKLADNGPHYRLGAAFRCTFMHTPAERLFPSDFLTFKVNGLVEEYDGRVGPQLTPLGEAVRASLRALANQAEPQ
ncbi:hypothetical protein MTsN3n11_24730 [Qipengyuania sp. MTN3-11]